MCEIFCGPSPKFFSKRYLNMKTEHQNKTSALNNAGTGQCDPHLAFVNTCLCTKRFSAPVLAQTRIHDPRIRSNN